MAAEKVNQEIDVSITSSTIYYFPAGRSVRLTLNGNGAWQHHDGSAWVSFTEGSGKNLTADVPQDGRLRVLVNSGTVVARAKVAHGS